GSGSRSRTGRPWSIFRRRLALPQSGNWTFLWVHCRRTVRPMETKAAPSERTRVRRLPDRGAYDQETIRAILDTGFVCHVGAGGGSPVVIPTAYARVGDFIVLHGSSKSRLMTVLGAGGEACVTVTHVDGFVMARSAFHHSINYRSVIVYGRGEAIIDEAGKYAALEAFMER